ncbi:5-methylcytosine restriction system specificity protein McrC [Prevotella sp. kh1p2]|uniref:5-methylcytosine restriction system specificity protein McrC n=1 Tax=Prevotella sp. kh1p2 TaxID=1761883 RepID=UPI0008B76B61|nr:hypothetical protein [Prevotella sp. kh1p2]SES75492.1 McrBC 5-methylcytosine restriction system component [Prevotella sp. kh1p2]SNU10519.1 McrBC 5-methylcytosine restriction system component [Prevotellaceae bacterium KH2P17]
MNVIKLKEQMPENTLLGQPERDSVLPYMADGEEITCQVRRGSNDSELCLKIVRKGNDIAATGSYFVGTDWIREKELAVLLSPKMNDDFEVDCVRMLNEALSDPANFSHLEGLLTIRFDKPPIRINQKQDFLSIFLITEYLHLLQCIVRKGLKKSFYVVEDNLKGKLKGRILIGKNIHENLTKGLVSNNVCRFQVYDIDSEENRILKKALRFCEKQLEMYPDTLNISSLKANVRYVKPSFAQVSDEVSVKTIKAFKGNPMFKEYNLAVEFARLLLHRYSYDITLAGREEIDTPPFWIDMSKLFELYVFCRLRAIFTVKNEVKYHFKAHRQELDFLLKPTQWPDPYVIDVKYKPRYKGSGGISMDDAREVSGYARLNKVYEELGLGENEALPIKCLIIYPNQEQEEQFTITKEQEPVFDKIPGYVRFYKIGIRLPVING